MTSPSLVGSYANVQIPAGLTLLESATRRENYIYLTLIRGATPEQANALILRKWRQAVDPESVAVANRFKPVTQEPCDLNPTQLSKTSGIPSKRLVQVGRTVLNLPVFETAIGLWTPRLALCRALGLHGSFLSRIAPTAGHTYELQRRGYTAKFRKIEDVINGGQALRCISLADAEIAIAVLANRGAQKNAA